MIGYFVKAAALALAVAVLAGLLKGRQASLAAALTLGGCAASHVLNRCYSLPKSRSIRAVPAGRYGPALPFSSV